jgi:hypothetical protein
MTWKQYTKLAIFSILLLVGLEVLEASVSGHTWEIIKVLVCLPGIAIFTVACVLGLRAKDWGGSLACAALVGIFTYGFVMSCIRILSWY